MRIFLSKIAYTYKCINLLSLFRQGNILYYKDSDDAIKKIEVARVITHAIAYQWLDNAFTASWWSDIWLNEGFAVLLQVNALNKVALLSFNVDSFEDYRYVIVIQNNT